MIFSWFLFLISRAFIPFKDQLRMIVNYWVNPALSMKYVPTRYMTILGLIRKKNCCFYRTRLKGTVSRDFLLLFLFMNQFPPSHRVFHKDRKIRGDIRSSRFATCVVDTGGKWKKSSIRKILIILLGHLWVVEETCI